MGGTSTKSTIQSLEMTSTSKFIYTEQGGGVDNMEESGSDSLSSKAGDLVRTRWVELFGILFLVAVAIDLGFYSGDTFVNGIKIWASNNNGLASLILSASLLYAYLLQFRTQDRQRVLMNQQKEIMDAGYTPLVGVTEQNVNDRTSSPEVPETESVELTVVNRGNSLATDLELHFLISYETNNQRYTDHSSPLRRTEDGVWWHAGSGGSISPEEPEVEFSTPARVTDTEYDQDEPVDISDAIDRIFDSKDDVDQIRIATQLHYKDAKANEKEIDLTIYTINSSNGDSDLKLSNGDSRTVEMSDDAREVEEIKA